LTACFVRENKIVEAKPIEAGKQFVKSYTMMNDGESEWPAGVYFTQLLQDEKTEDLQVHGVWPNNEKEAQTVAPGKSVTF